jgi:uncharacterized membrane protein YeiH
LYAAEIAGTVIFAVSGVLAVTRRGLDAVGALMLGYLLHGGATLLDRA